MTDNVVQQENDVPVATDVAAPEASTPERRGRGGYNSRDGGSSFRKNRRAPRKQQPRSEYDQRMLAIRRVTRVSSGGRRFSFSVAMAIGDRKGKVGVGIGKAGDTALAIEKAIKDAKKHLVTVPRTSSLSIPHLVEAKYSSAVVSIQPSAGRGLVAGSAVRDLAELAGVNDIVGKVRSGSKNKLNIARATLKALEKLQAPKSHDTAKATK